jgi:hypothetical protein
VRGSYIFFASTMFSQLTEVDQVAQRVVLREAPVERPVHPDLWMSEAMIERDN